MITDCRCPDCNTYCYDYYEGSCGPQFCDDEMIFIDYNVHCKCGCKFTYTEWFKLNETTTERQ